MRCLFVITKSSLPSKLDTNPTAVAENVRPRS
jgi:hypothetical protein